MAASLSPTPTRFAPVSLPPRAGYVDMTAFPVDTSRNAVNQGGVGGFNNGANWRNNPTNMPFTSQPGPVYRNDSVFLSANQPYRARAGWNTVVTTYVPFQPYVLAGVPQSGGAATAAQVQARVQQLLAIRQRLQAGKRVKS